MMIKQLLPPVFVSLVDTTQKDGHYMYMQVYVSNYMNFNKYLLKTD